MLFESPFYVDYPVTLGVAFGAASLAAIWLLIVFNKRGSFYEMVIGYFHRRSPGIPQEKLPVLGRTFFIVLAVGFGAAGLVPALIATGIVKNKDVSISPEQKMRNKEALEKLRQQYETEK